jgi:hypothetical protein
VNDYGMSKPIHDNKFISDTTEDPYFYPPARFCANGQSCADAHNGRGRKMAALNPESICYACQHRELMRNMNKIQVVGELFPARARRQGLSL